MEKPRELHCRHVKRLMRYVMFTKIYSLVYSNNTPSITWYTDSDFAYSTKDRKSISGYQPYMVNVLYHRTVQNIKQ